MKPKSCANCTAFVPMAGEPSPEGALPGECRAKAPVILAQWFSNTGMGWQAGWPPTNTQRWCREHETKLEVLEGGKE